MVERRQFATWDGDQWPNARDDNCVIGIVIGIRIGLWLAEAPISDTAE
jgi:hypothetical protein